jgi:hypothetical protein
MSTTIASFSTASKTRQRPSGLRSTSTWCSVPSRARYWAAITGAGIAVSLRVVVGVAVAVAERCVGFLPGKRASDAIGD